MKKKVKDIIKQMEKIYLYDNRPWIIGYSGGKDSTLVLELAYIMLKNLPENKRKKPVYVVSSDTLIENPIVLNRLKSSIRRINESAVEDNLPLTAQLVYPRYDDSFWTNLIGKGFPTPKSVSFRWCTQRLKIDPTNRFIEEKINENGEVIVLLGVRKDESITRKESIERRQIEGYILNPHGSLKNTYVYSPIVDLTTDEVWATLLSDGGRNPWGENNNYLIDLYEEGSEEECPFIMPSGSEKEVKSCANTRFGCWVCTIVKEDKSLKSFINNGYHELIPLLEFRNWLLDIRDNRKYRDKKQRNGRIYRRKILKKNLTKKEILMYEEECSESDKGIDKNGDYYYWVKGLGPFNYEARKMILKKLLEVQKLVGIELIKIEELKEIENIWNKEFDIRKNSLAKIYEEVMGEKLPWSKHIEPILEESVISDLDVLLDKYGVNKELYYKLLILTDDNKIYTNKTNYKKSLDKLLNQQWVHRELYDEEY